MFVLLNFFVKKREFLYFGLLYFLVSLFLNFEFKFISSWICCYKFVRVIYVCSFNLLKKLWYFIGYYLHFKNLVSFLKKILWCEITWCFYFLDLIKFCISIKFCFIWWYKFGSSLTCLLKFLPFLANKFLYHKYNTRYEQKLFCCRKFFKKKDCEIFSLFLRDSLNKFCLSWKVSN